VGKTAGSGAGHRWVLGVRFVRVGKVVPLINPSAHSDGVLLSSIDAKTKHCFKNLINLNKKTLNHKNASYTL
jgi:hypothetical protein